ncbi:MAG: hypothetical protein ACYSTS_18940 [Planctomycetota bacterium]
MRKVESNIQEKKPYTERESLSGEFQKSLFEKEEKGARTFSSKHNPPFLEEMSSEPICPETIRSQSYHNDKFIRRYSSK